MQGKIHSALPHLQGKKKFRYYRWTHVILYPAVDCRGIEWVCYLNVNRNCWHAGYRSVLWYTISAAASDRQLGWKAFVKWCQWGELENSGRIERFVVIQVLEWDRTKAELIDFSNPACHSQLIVFFLLKLSFRSYMTSHHNHPHSDMPLFQQLLRGLWVLFPQKKKKTLPLDCSTLCSCETSQGQAVQALPTFLPFPSCPSSQYVRFKSLINSWFIENSLYYSFLLTRW